MVEIGITLGETDEAVHNGSSAPSDIGGRFLSVSNCLGSGNLYHVQSLLRIEKIMSK